MQRRAPTAAAKLAAAAVLLATSGLGAETRVAEIEQDYEANPVWEWLFGHTWRDLWNTPVELPVLDLRGIGGGLAAEKTVGGHQTAGLALQGEDGRSYTFRSLEKTSFVPHWLDWAPATVLLRDQTSGNLPGADVVVSRLAHELGIRVTPRRLGILPDDPRLGAFRESFAHRVGSISEYPTPGSEAEPGTFGATRILESEELWELVRSGADAEIDARAYLRARLLHWWVADFDRHPGQWRWARIVGKPRWQPLPEDHDHGFPHYDGVVNALARLGNDWLMRFDERYVRAGLVNNSRDLDAWLLARLERNAWQTEVTSFVQQARAGVIEAGLAALPPGWREEAGAELRATLEVRLDGLEAFAMEVYSWLSRDVRVYGSDADDRVELTCLEPGTLELTLWRGRSTRPWRRRFRSEETRRIEILWLEGRDSLARDFGGTCGFELVERKPLRPDLDAGVPVHPGLEVDRRPRNRPGRRLLPGADRASR